MNLFRTFIHKPLLNALVAENAVEMNGLDKSTVTDLSPEAADFLANALTRDMRAVQSSILSTQDWDEYMLEPPYEVRRLVAIAFAREGADVLVSYLDEHDDAGETIRWVEQAGRRCVAVKADVRDREELRAALPFGSYRSVAAWGDGKGGPRNGFVSPYAAMNVEECVAETVAALAGRISRRTTSPVSVVATIAPLLRKLDRLDPTYKN